MIAIVSGLPRSGTSLAMQMLEAGGIPALTDPEGAASHRASDASNPRGYYELDAVRRLRSGAPWIAEAEGRAVKVVAPLLGFLPQGHAYRVVFVTRDLDEVLDSQVTMLERLGRPAGDRSVLRVAFEKQLEAARYLLATQERFAVHYADHASLLSRPAEVAQGIADFFSEASVSLAVAPMANVVDRALYRARSAT